MKFNIPRITKKNIFFVSKMISSQPTIKGAGGTISLVELIWVLKKLCWGIIPDITLHASENSLGPYWVPLVLGQC